MVTQTQYNKIKAICVVDTVDGVNMESLTIGKVYELTPDSVITYPRWYWVINDVGRDSYCPGLLFKPLEDHREEMLNQLL